MASEKMSKSSDHDLLIEINSEVKNISAQFEKLCDKVDTNTGRLDKMETWRDRVNGALFVLGAISAIITTFISSKLSKIF